MSDSKTAELSQENSDSILLTIEDIAALFHIDIGTARTRLHRGMLPAPLSIPGRRRYWRRVDVLAWIDGHAAPAEQSAPAPAPKPAVVRSGKRGRPRNHTGSPVQRRDASQGDIETYLGQVG